MGNRIKNSTKELLSLSAMEVAEGFSPRVGASSTIISPRCSIFGQTSGNVSEVPNLITM